MKYLPVGAHRRHKGRSWSHHFASSPFNDSQDSDGGNTRDDRTASSMYGRNKISLTFYRQSIDDRVRPYEIWHLNHPMDYRELIEGTVRGFDKFRHMVLVMPSPNYCRLSIMPRLRPMGQSCESFLTTVSASPRPTLLQIPVTPAIPPLSLKPV